MTERSIGRYENTTGSVTVGNVMMSRLRSRHNRLRQLNRRRPDVPVADTWPSTSPVVRTRVSLTGAVLVPDVFVELAQLVAALLAPGLHGCLERVERLAPEAHVLHGVLDLLVQRRG